MITLPWWLLVLLWLVSLAVTIWMSIHFAMWAMTRLDEQDKGEDPDEFYPWSWRVFAGADIYFAWLNKRLDERLEREGHG